MLSTHVMPFSLQDKLFNFTKWILPVHLGHHWAMLVRLMLSIRMNEDTSLFLQVVDFSKRVISYGDSIDCRSGLPLIKKLL